MITLTTRLTTSGQFLFQPAVERNVEWVDRVNARIRVCVHIIHIFYLEVNTLFQAEAVPTGSEEGLCRKWSKCAMFFFSTANLWKISAPNVRRHWGIRPYIIIILYITDVIKHGICRKMAKTEVFFSSLLSFHITLFFKILSNYYLFNLF